MIYHRTFHSLARMGSLLFLLAALFATSCAQLPVATAVVGPVTMRLLGKGAFSGQVTARTEVLRDQPAWAKFWDQHATTARGATNLPTVDFAKELVLVATLGRKNSGGYSIEITKVEAEPKALKVFVRRKSPPPGGMSIQALTAPFHFVAVPATKLPVVFVDEN